MIAAATPLSPLLIEINADTAVLSSRCPALQSLLPQSW